MDRPDYVHCVKHESSKSWCGRDVSWEWAFEDATHAILNARNMGRLLICRECSKKLVEVIRGGTWLIPW